MSPLYNILTATFKKLNLHIYKRLIKGDVELCLDVVKTEDYLVRLNFNYAMQIICIEIITKKDKWVVLTSFEKFFKQYYCIYPFYLKLKDILSTRNRYKIIDFLKQFGLSMSYEKFANLLGV